MAKTTPASLKVATKNTSTAHIPDSVEDIKKMTANTRLLAVKTLVTQSAENLDKAAKIFAVMESMDDDTSAIPMGIARTLRAIAAKELLPETALAFHGTLLRRVGALPVNIQSELIKPDAAVKVVVGAKTRALPVQTLTAHQANTVFSPDGIRTIQEQREFLKTYTEQGKLLGKQSIGRVLKINAIKPGVSEIIIHVAGKHEIKIKDLVSVKPYLSA